jgi:trehalose 6-phosphate synthase
VDADRRRLIVVSNRGPVSYALEDGERVARRGSGGLVTALGGLVSHHDVTWIASALTDEDTAVALDAGGAFDNTARDGSPYRMRFVVHDPDAYDRFYNVVANPVLWFLQHYLWDLPLAPSFDAAFEEAWDEGYAAVNTAFAEAVVEELDADPAATVFFQDYHVYLAPRIVRERRPDAHLAHFVHIPWPGPDYWYVLPERMRAAIHDGVLANDVLGFHADRWRLNFLRSAADIAGGRPDYEDHSAVEHDGRRVLLSAHAISVDASEFERAAASDAVLAAERELEASRPEKLILRVDRSDPSKNAVRGLRAFELYLERHPESLGRVGMLALLNPSRQDIPVYARYLAAIEATALRVNDRFGRDGWTPVDLRVGDDFAQSVAGYKQFDVLLVNSVFDGCNLVAKEAPLVNERGGAVVLSENAGAIEELRDWVIAVNPFDLVGQAEAIHHALELPAEERRRRLEGLRAHVREHDVAAWAEAQLADFDRATSTGVRR